MTRAIEFEFYDKKLGFMGKVVSMSIDQNWAMVTFSYAQPETPDDEVNLSDGFLRQFTGLFDKNGVKIFEGDIIQFTYWWFDGEEQQSILTGELIYSEDLISFQLKGVRNSVWEKHNGYQDDCEYLVPFATLNFDEADFEVIGNIYLNPELINKEQND
tara:strand:+ start:234 stop:707 length:474 start_codon:yes stop_codon:yes gene_type:complete